MDIKEAIKTVQAKKSKENFLVIEFNYDKKLVLPHKDGVAFLAALAQAEQLKEPYNEPHSISGVERDIYRTFALSHEEYEQYKVASLLGISISDVRELQRTKT